MVCISPRIYIHLIGRTGEEAAVSHPAVAEAAVVGKPDVEKGEAIILFVTLKADTSPSTSLSQELVQHLLRDDAALCQLAQHAV